MNRDSFKVESTELKVVTEAQETSIILFEENANSSHLPGTDFHTVWTSNKSIYQRPSAEGVDEPPILGLIGGDTVRATYEDGLTDTGETNVEISISCRANSDRLGTAYQVDRS